MAKSKTLPEAVTELYGLLEPFETDARQKIVSSVMVLLGEEAKVPQKHEEGGGEGAADHEMVLGTKAKRWMNQNSVSAEMIHEVFHFESGDVEVIAGAIPGRGKKGQSINCYLLAGLRAFLSSDEAKFTDEEAVELCKSMGCHDSGNHAKTRGEFGSNVAGSKSAGFKLPAPGLRAAADLIKEMSGQG